MKFLSRLLVSALLASVVFATMAVPAHASQLVFDEEFSGTTLDSSVWTRTDPWWQLHGHDDLQYFDPAMSTVSGGNCDLRAERRTANGYDYQAGIISSLNHTKFSYGYFEVRAKLPAGPGIWPAFWMVGAHTEIDGFEVPGDVPGRVYCTYHSGDSQVFQAHKDGSTWTTAFHTYAIDWQPTYIKWYIDDQLVGTYAHATPNDPQTICFNTIVGGIWSGPPTSATQFPNDFLIDYVRVYDTKPLPNTAPVATDDSYDATSNATLNVSATKGVLANDSDAQGDALTASVVAQPAHGTVTMQSNGSFTYTPAADYWGVDSFTYRTSDGKVYSSNATVWLTVASANVAAPVAAADKYSTAQNAPLSVDSTRAGVLGNDSDPASLPLTAMLLQKPKHGTVSLANDGTFIYLPRSGYSGTDTFTYVASNGKTVSDATAVSITVLAPTVVGKPTVKKRTRSTYQVSGSVQVGSKSVASLESASNPVLYVVTQRYTKGHWRDYRKVRIVNPASKYTARIHLRRGSYRVRTSLVGGDVPQGVSAWSKRFRVR
jgi:VCBS repeat-containing protein